MLVRFSNIDGCATCTQTVDFNKLRAIGMLQAANASYYVRISFENGDALIVKRNLTLHSAIACRNQLEALWLNSLTGFMNNDAVLLFD